MIQEEENKRGRGEESILCMTGIKKRTSSHKPNTRRKENEENIQEKKDEGIVRKRHKMMRKKNGNQVEILSIDLKPR